MSPIKGTRRVLVLCSSVLLHVSLVCSLDWVAVKELKLSYSIGETLLFTIYAHYGNPKP